MLQTEIVEFDPTSHLHKEFILSSFNAKTLSKNKIYWIHINLEEKGSLETAALLFELPQHFIEMCDVNYKSQHVIETENSLSLQLRSVSIDKTTNHLKSKLDFNTLTIHLTDTFCLTASTNPQPALETFKTNYKINLRYAQTPGFILFLILDNIVNDFSNVSEYLELLSDDTELHVRENHNGSYADIMKIKTKVIKLRRCVNALRDILMRISGRKIAVISQACKQSLMELLAHVLTIINEIDAVRDILNSSLDYVDNRLMQKMNETMRILTAFTSILLPITVIAGIYGMNFQIMPELSWRYGYLWALGLMLMSSVLLTMYFKRKNWF